MCDPVTLVLFNNADAVAKYQETNVFVAHDLHGHV